MIFLSMLLMGGLIGFIGAGGAGVVIAVLTMVFAVPIHTALGTSLGAMVFTTLAGAYSHFREGNVEVKTGAAIGAAGAAGAFAGARLAAFLPSHDLKTLTASMLLLSAFLVYMRVFWPNNIFLSPRRRGKPAAGGRFWLLAALVGVGNGLLSGTFGFGAAQFIQLSLLVFFAVPLYQTVGTTMLVILPIAAFGGLGYLLQGHLDLMLFIQVLFGLMIGAFFGAKFTRLAPPAVLKWAMVLLPTIGGLSMLL